MATPKKFRVKVRNTEGTLFDGEVERISSFNEVGPFDIYPMHANFISILRQEVALYNNDQKIKELKFEQAVLKVKRDVASIFLGIEVLFVDDRKAVGK
jgi:F0F1-type ATP synthase epsilon subunit